MNRITRATPASPCQTHTLHGGDGADRFAYDEKTFGDDIVKDFEDGTDLVSFSFSRSTGLTFDDLKIVDNADGHAEVSVKKEKDGFVGKIVLEDVAASDLTEADFLFAA